jgi:hypothetical protein
VENISTSIEPRKFDLSDMEVFSNKESRLIVYDFGLSIVKKSRIRIIPSLLLSVTRKLTSGIFRFITQYPKNNILELYELFLTTGKIPELRKIGFLL